MQTAGKTRKRFTAQEREEKKAFAEREKNLKAYFADRSAQAVALRSEDRGSYGLERELKDTQENVIEAFEKTKKIKHSRDVGTIREEIVRTFLTWIGLLPAKYTIFDTSVRVTSMTGHLSKELDLLTIDSLDSISLMREDRVYDVFPVEVVCGTVQVKPKATEKDIRDGLLNIASLKSLERYGSHLH